MKSYKVYGIKRDGKRWSTPKGKNNWKSIGAAKNSYLLHEFKNFRMLWENMPLEKRAEVIELGEFIWIPSIENEKRKDKF